ncbi:MAG: SCO family protein [Proteobacteria bacterium]|nr:SCO family protein [Pseudomonadota bacterium]
MNRNTLVFISVALLAAAAGVLAGALLLAPAEPAQLVAGTKLETPRPLPAFQLVRDDESPFTRADFEGEWQLVFFGFTHCPDVCPNTLFLLDRVVEQLDNADHVAPEVVFVSVDPERDTPEQVKQYVEYFNDDFVGVTAHGSDDGMENLQRLTQAMSVAYEFHPEGDSYEVIHSSAVLLVNPEAEMHALFTPPLNAADIAADLAQLISN